VTKQTLAPRSVWLALAFGLAFFVVPDCCLTGSHAHGAAMPAYGPICRALAG